MVKQLLHSTSFTTLATTCVNTLAGIAMARALGPEGRGALGAIITWPPVFMTLVFFGLQEWISIEVGKSQQALSQNKSFQAVLKWGFVLGLFGVLLCNVGFEFLVSPSQKSFIPLFRAYSLYVLMALWLALYNNAIMALNNTWAFNISRWIQALSHLLLVMLICLYSSNALTHLVYEHLIMSSLPLIYYFYKYPPPLKNIVVAPELGILKKSLPLHPSFVLATLSLLLDRALAVFYLPNQDIGYYHIAYSLAFSVTSIFGITFQYLVLPQASQISDNKEKQKYVIGNVQMSALLLLAASLLSLPLVQPLVIFLFGSAFQPAVGIAYFLLPAFALVYTKSIASRSIKSLKMIRLSNWVEIVFVLLLVGSVVLCKIWNLLNTQVLAQVCLISAAVSYLVFLLGFKWSSQLPLRDFFDIRHPFMVLMTKLRSLIYG